MFSFGVIVVVLCFVPGQIWSKKVVSHKTTHSDSGLSSWCTKTINDPNYPNIPDECCNADAFSCGKFIEGKTTKYGLTNPSSWTTRLCICDVAFYYCITRYLKFYDALEIYALFIRDQCFRKKRHQPNAMRKDVEYEFVNAAVMIDKSL